MYSVPNSTSLTSYLCTSYSRAGSPERVSVALQSPSALPALCTCRPPLWLCPSSELTVRFLRLYRLPVPPGLTSKHPASVRIPTALAAPSSDLCVTAPTANRCAVWSHRCVGVEVVSLLAVICVACNIPSALTAVNHHAQHRAGSSPRRSPCHTQYVDCSRRALVLPASSALPPCRVALPCASRVVCSTFIPLQHHTRQECCIYGARFLHNLAKLVLSDGLVHSIDDCSALTIAGVNSPV